MREIPKDAFAALKAALLDALNANTNVSGLRIVPPKVSDEDLESAACIALMSLTKDWVRPNGVQFAARGPGLDEMRWF